jgi:ribonuclease HII
VKRIMGIDEAGRGCVIGPLVICGVVVRHECLETLVEVGVKDSKQLSAARRQALCGHITDIIERSFIAEIPPRQIDQNNINTLELLEMTRMIAAAEPDEVFIDVPTRGRGIATYCQRIRALLPKPGVALIAENKADQTYPVVSAASIIAKVTRDTVIEKLRNEYGDFGSGYASDPRTKKFVADCYAATGEFPEIVRHKWLTVRRFTDPQLSLFSSR